MRKAFASGSLFASTHGSPPWRVVALPGWMHTASDFDAVLEPLQVGSLAVDLPGFGGLNPPPAAVWGAAEYARWLEPLLDELDGPVVLAGHSRGGAIALRLAVRRPQAVSALVLTGVPLLRDPDRPQAKAPAAFRAAKWLHRRGVVSDDRMEAARRRYGSADYRNATGVMRDILVKVTNETYEDELRAVSCPVELVWGENDDAAPLPVARRAAGLLGERATMTVVHGAGHQIPMQAPDALRAAVERALVHP